MSKTILLFDMSISRRPSAVVLSATAVTALALGTVVATGGASAAPGVPPSMVDADPSIAQSATDPFYTPPSEIPDTPGSMIRSQFAPQLLDAFDVGDTPGRADKILYTSTTQDNVPIASSGVVLQPTGKWNGKGPTPTIVFAPGTRGSGDDCAPSRARGLLASANVANDAVNLNYEYPFFAAASALGYRVIVADLIGLGTPGQHTYANHTEEAHAVLDATRAGLAFAKAPANSPVAFYGYSQGGGAAAAAAEHAASYAPELNVKGTFAGAPPADLESVEGAIDDHVISGALGYAFNGAISRHPELASLPDEYFNDEGKQFLKATADECIINSVDNWMFRDTRTLTKDGRSFGEIVRDDDRLRSVLLGDNYKLGISALSAPILLVNGRNDDTIPWQQARDTAAAYCASGGTVQFETDETPVIFPPKTVVAHGFALITKSGTAFEYLTDRFNDVPAPNNCGQF